MKRLKRRVLGLCLVVGLGGLVLGVLAVGGVVMVASDHEHLQQSMAYTVSDHEIE